MAIGKRLAGVNETHQEWPFTKTRQIRERLCEPPKENRASEYWKKQVEKTRAVVLLYSLQVHHRPAMKNF
jgi:hypothetical protein